MQARVDGATARAPLVEEPPLPLGCAMRALIRCGARTALLLARHRIRQPAGNVGRRIRFRDGSSAEVYRETVVDRPPPAAPTAVVVGFRLRRVRSAWAHALFRLESELNTVLFAGFPGLVSKLWFGHDEHGLYRGVYQWDDPGLAVAYVRALWWVLALVSERTSIHYAVLPGLLREEVLTDPSVVDGDDWWCPAA